MAGSEWPKINDADWGICLPGTVKMLKPVQDSDGSWIYRFEFRPEGWNGEYAEEVAATREVIERMRPFHEIEALAKVCPDTERYDR